jgi:hypothetical protein
VIQGVDSDLNRLLDAVANQFGIDWLSRNGDNPVQAVWQLRDAQSTNELLLLGEAIVNLAAADSRWVSRQIREIKEGDAGRRAGAIFEMLGLNMFHGPNQRVEPASANNPGYDGKVFFPDGSSLMLSIKNHGSTSAELSFREKAVRINQAFLAAASKHGRNGFMNRIIATAYPSEADCRQLQDRMDGIVAGTNRPMDGIWNGSLPPLPPIYAPLSARHLSYMSLIFAPYHQNEQNNFYENIRKGIANLERHHAAVPDHVCRTLMLRVSASASVSKCVEWAQTYFNDFPETAIELILLYQAVPATDLAVEPQQVILG